MRWAGHLERMGAMRMHMGVWLEHLGKGPVGGSRRWWEFNINLYFEVKRFVHYCYNQLYSETNVHIKMQAVHKS